MQFIANGPDIPDELLQKHEEGRVVFFCGAGISYPAGLPGFDGLVDKIYLELHTDNSSFPLEKKAYEDKRYDVALHLLERRFPGQRRAVREALFHVLRPNFRRKGAMDTHMALLRLARCHEGNLHLVTTNFDRIFERAAKPTKQSFNIFAAPMLPVPKNSRWDGLVYLHGLLPVNPKDESSLNRLVLTSGDFGLAYLTERWAARFVSELFRNYVVCFVGYSIDDPVMRYMTDALAADRMLGENSPQAYAFAGYENGQESTKTKEWEAKEITPILYEIPSDSHNHSMLHRTLKVWSETYRDGILGKERIVVEYAMTRPSYSTTQDNFVGRVLWALSDESGLPAKRFAEFDPAPSLDWLKEFSAMNYQWRDLNRFGISPHIRTNEDFRFSLICRPTPSARAPSMALVSFGAAASQWDEVMPHIARWLMRHLNDPELAIWLAQQGGQLHPDFSRHLRNELIRFARLQQEGETKELDRIRTQAPNAIPGSLMRTLWQVFLSGRVKSPLPNPDFYHWKDRLKHNGLTPTIRLELRDLLAPKIELERPIRWAPEEKRDEEATSIKQLVDWELVLSSDHVHSSFRSLVNDECWKNALPNLLNDFQQLLRDALDLLRELDASDFYDRSIWDLPSISPHPQNRQFTDWVMLIELLRDAWLATRSTDPARAVRIARNWFEEPYPTFKRLALFAAGQENCIGPDQWVEWLTVNEAWWLWAKETKRETMRLLVLQGHHLTAPALERIETAILDGPPRKMFRSDIDPGEWKNKAEYEIWLHLAKLNASSAALGRRANERLAMLSELHPQWRLAPNQQDEFSVWMHGTNEPDFEERRRVDIAPRKRRELVQWLKLPPPDVFPFYEDTWPNTCRTRFFHCLGALCDLAKEGIWIAFRWRDALQTWSEDGLVSRSWRYAAPLVRDMPDEILQEIVHSITWWMSKAFEVRNPHESVSDMHEDVLLELSRRVLELPFDTASSITQDEHPIDEPIDDAINHPIGHVTEALLNVLFKRDPNDNDGLPTDIEPFFSSLCNCTIDRFRHGRVLLASRVIALFRIDRRWTGKYLLPLFDWKNRTEAKAAWDGFLWSPRLYQPLLFALKSQFLECAGHYEALGEHRRQFAMFLTYIALNIPEGYTAEDFRFAFEKLPLDALGEAARTLVQALEGSDEKQEEYWNNRILPFWNYVWPKSRDRMTDDIAESLARLSIAAGKNFPAALRTVKDWLQPIEYTDLIVDSMQKSDVCRHFPTDALRLLNAVIDDRSLESSDLKQCLEAMKQSSPEIENEPSYQTLVEYGREKGIL